MDTDKLETIVETMFPLEEIEESWPNVAETEYFVQTNKRIVRLGFDGSVLDINY